MTKKKTFEFRSPDSESVLYACGECGRVYGPGMFATHDNANAERIASECCVPLVCECGAECPRSRTACDACRARRRETRLTERFENATKVAMGDWTGPVYDPYSERYHPSLQDLFDNVEEEGDVPDYVHPCHETKISINVEDWLDQTLEDLCLEEPADVEWNGFEDLTKAVAEFNAAQDYAVWNEDRSRAIDLRTSDDMSSVDNRSDPRTVVKEA